MTIPTSEEGLPDPNPPFDFFNVGRFLNYPYTLRHNLVDRRIPRKWSTLNLENEYLKCTVLPDLGGHPIHRIGIELRAISVERRKQ